VYINGNSTHEIKLPVTLEDIIENSVPALLGKKKVIHSEKKYVICYPSAFNSVVG